MPRSFPFKVVAGALLLGAACLTACSSSGTPEESAQAQDKFFIAVGSGDPQRVMALMHPELKKQVDEPLLADWMKQLNASLGKYEGMSWTDWNASVKIENGVKYNKAKGTFNFAKGDAKGEFVYAGGQLTSFKVDSDKLPKDWFRGPSDPTMYRNRGADFLRHLYARQFEAAYALTDQRFRDSVSLQTLENAAAEMESAMGKVGKVEFDHQQWLAEGGGRLAIYYRVESEKPLDGVTPYLHAEVQFVFEGLKGFLMKFSNGANGTVELPAEQAQQLEPHAQKFAEGLEAQDAAQMIAALDESVRSRVDAPVLAAWLAAVSAKQGKLDKLSSIKHQITYQGGRRSMGSEIACAHEKGEVVWQLTYQGEPAEAVTGFTVDAQHLAGWRQQLDATVYKQRGKEFLDKWFAGEIDAAYAMMGGSLQEAAPPEKLMALRETVLASTGALKSSEAGEPVFAESDVRELIVPYKLMLEKRETTGTVTFILSEAALVLNGFNVKID
jgi:hypothetical protein